MICRAEKEQMIDEKIGERRGNDRDKTTVRIVVDEGETAAPVAWWEGSEPSSMDLRDEVGVWQSETGTTGGGERWLPGPMPSSIPHPSPDGGPRVGRNGIDASARDDDPTGLYLREIGQTSLLTRREEVELAQAMEEGKKAQALLADLGTRGQ